LFLWRQPLAALGARCRERLAAPTAVIIAAMRLLGHDRRRKPANCDEQAEHRHIEQRVAVRLASDWHHAFSYCENT
jgi:hypothetical protein